MKKNLLYALTAVAMLTGCAKSDVVDSEINKESNLIGFSTYKNISRGNPVDNNTEFLTKDNTFGVTAFVNIEGGDSPYMGTATEGIKIISDGTKWTYANTSNQAYWPTEALDFYAYAPYGNTAITAKTFDKTNGLTLTYTVPDAETSQVDLMYALAIGKTKEEGNTVTLPFKHALTQVHFKVGTKTTNLKVDIAENGIQIHNLKNSGSFNTKTETWTLDATTAAYTVTSDAVTGNYTDGTEANPYTKIGSDDKALMLLPQGFVAGDGENTGAYLTISCKIYQVLANGETKVYLHGSESAFADVTVGISSAISYTEEGEQSTSEIWLRNKKVTYNLLFGAGDGVLFPIEFATTVETWEDADGGVIEPK
ncbi:fimbrillin family protein [Butyricimonas hominis]|uniref:Fimbrillin family protein n=1 Tax=Butyricimonas hominis TaxID=2763032 RepID=A0ABR7D5T0_9BACT|nr:fimbrillin family protein [Butyricimonas hominis]MBC5623112.1 fimbrillin family protein [Butyricimonas hominis]